MTQRDDWGWQARIGMFVVGSEVVPEAEWWAMVPLNVSVHAARVTARRPGRAGATTAAGWSWKMTCCAAAGIRTDVPVGGRGWPQLQQHPG